MNILKTSLILYPSVPGSPRSNHVKTYISSEPIVPTYDLPNWTVWMVRIGFTIGVITFARFAWGLLGELIEKIAKSIL